jgi:hypothetical protein
MRSGPSLLLLCLGVVTLVACSESDPQAQARRAATRTDLIGGPSALGELGDFVLENDKIRVVVQDKGFSRGFGVYGGGLIDADLNRPQAPGDSGGGRGKDQFGELFPMFFVQALEPDNVEVLADGKDGKTARIRVSGTGGEFLTLVTVLNHLIVNSYELPSLAEIIQKGAAALSDEARLRFEIDYELDPGAQYVRIHTRLINPGEEAVQLPSPDLGVVGALVDGLDRLRVPVGAITLFGAGNKVFAPGYGYGLRYQIEDASGAEGLGFPALPGVLVPGLISTSSNGISYGFFALPDPEITTFAMGQTAEDEDGNTYNLYQHAYDRPVGRDTMVVPFIASSFTGVFYGQVDAEIAPGGSWQQTTYFIVGDGDAAAILDVVHDLRGDTVGKVSGRVLDQLTASPVDKASVVVFDADGRPANQFFAVNGGYFTGTLPPGRYTAKVVDHPVTSEAVEFEVKAGAETRLQLGVPPTGTVSVLVVDTSGRALPAKATAVGTHDQPTEAGADPREFLFDLPAGEHWRVTDLVPDDPDDPETRKYIEEVAFTEDGVATLHLPAGRPYDIWVSRGQEYTVHRETVTVAPGKVKTLNAKLERVVDTTGFISGDFHIHAAPSLDSSVPLDERVITGISEGVELLVSTDHNAVTDYAPYIERAGYEAWATSLIGLELTTLESGHFNGFPLRRDAGAITHGAFEWSQRTPEAIWADLRALGEYGPDKTIVQVNHARDSILGYFDQYGFDGLTGELLPPPPPTDLFGKILAPAGPAFFEEIMCEDNPDETCQISSFSYGFDAMELLNGGVASQLHHARVPESMEPYKDARALAGYPAEGELTDAQQEIVDDLQDVLDDLQDAEPGAVLCEDGEVAYPGVLDDWWNLLNTGHRFTGLANSDSHSQESIGYPRSYLNVGKDDPMKLDGLEVVEAIQAHAVVMSWGPFLNVTADGAPVGAEIATSDGNVDVKVTIRSAPWIQVDRWRMVVNGRIGPWKTVEMGADGEFEATEVLELDRDSWFLVEVTGDKSLFPVVLPYDEPSAQLADVLGGLADSLGFGAEPFGKLARSPEDFRIPRLSPPLIEARKPMAITNPIWIRADGDDDWTPPGVVPRICPPRSFASELVDMDAVSAGMRSIILEPPMSDRKKIERVLHPSIGFPRVRNELADVRVIFEQFYRHNH